MTNVATEAVADFDPFAGPQIARVVPTTEAQREIWLADRLSREASLAYNESVTLRMRGRLDPGRLAGAVCDLVRRHESLRATFSDDGQQMYIATDAVLQVDVDDVTALDALARTRVLEAEQRSAVETPFDLVHGPLVRARLLRLAPDDHALVLTVHHIVCDGYSFGILVRELAALYTAMAHGTAPNLPDPPAYSDYAVEEVEFHTTDEYRSDETFWAAQFQGTPPTLDLPVDRPRGTWRTFASRREDHELDASLVAALRSLGGRHGSSLFVTLLTGFGALLGRIAGTDDVVVGVPAAGQSATGRPGLVGHCVNLLPIRVAPDATRPFTSTLAATRTVVLDAFEHQRYTFGSLLKKLAVKRDPSRLPLVSVMFNLDQAVEGAAISLAGADAHFSGNPRSYENFELFVNAVQSGGAIRLECQYNADLFDADTVRRWLRCYEALLRGVVHAPDSMLVSIGISPDADFVLLRRWNATDRDYPRTVPVHELLRECVAERSEHTAVRCGDRTLTYRELFSRAERIAAALQARGVGRGALIGLCLDRTVDLVAAVLGVLRSGAGYVPLDPTYPRDRLHFMATDAALAVLLVDERGRGAFDWPADRTLELGVALENSESSTPAAVVPDDVAYVIYTSGSTGKPKGVRVPHGAVVNFLNSMRREPGVGPNDVVVAVTTLSFDIAVNELLTPLCAGATVVVATRNEAGDGQALRRLVESHAATAMQATPATWRMLLEAGWTGGPGFRVLCGGESLDGDLARRLAKVCGELWNMYGPTETTVWSTCRRIDADGPITIGAPISNTSVWVLDQGGNHCPIGVPGEIYIGGDGVTLGYLNRPELTAERFVADPFDGRPGRRLYRTGDRGRWRSDGTIEHLGRLDFQVKVRGYRIELGEIETALTTFSEVARAVALVREDRAEDVRLVAYLVARGATVSDDGLRAHLRRTLPDYMVPQHFVWLPAIPLLPNGKVDRAALPPPETARASISTVPPRDELERQLAAAMEDVLGLPGLGVHDDFFALGGHSLLAARLTARVNQDHGVQLPLKTLFEAPTVAQLAALLRSSTTGPADGVPLVHYRTAGTAPLSLNQERLWFLEQLNPGRVVYNTPSAHRLRGPLELEAFNAAFRALVQRQGSLRTCIAVLPTGAVQRIYESLDVSLLPVEDLTGIAPDRREHELMARLESLVNVPFDLTIAPLFRTRLFRLAEDDHVLFLMPHHLIWDGWSFDLFYDEMAALYQARADGRDDPLAPLEFTYADYAHWHREWSASPECARQVEFWRNRLSRMHGTRELPTDLPRRPGMSGGGATEWLAVDAGLTDALHRVSREADATMFMTLLAAYGLLLNKSTGLERFVIGTPVRGRSHPALEPVMGYFANLLPLQVEIDPNASFVEHVRRTRAAVLEAFTYPEVPLESLASDLGVRRAAGGTLLYQALFSFQDARLRSTRWGSLAHSQIPLFQRGATEDLGLWVMETGDGMLGGVTYNTDIVLPATAKALRERYLGVLRDVAADSSIRIGAVRIANDEDRAALERFASTARAWDAPASVRECVRRVARERPDASAVVDSTGTCSYASLDARASRVARGLRASGIGIGNRVFVALERSADVAIAVLAVLEAGGDVCLREPAEFDEMSVPDGSLVIAPVERPQHGLPARSLAALEATGMACAGADGASGATATGGSGAVYVRYWAPTGAQREVRLDERAVRDTLLGFGAALALSANDRWLAAYPTSADCAAHELLLPLVHGAALVIGRDEDIAEPTALAACAERNFATFVHAPASALAGVMPDRWPRAAQVVWSGRLPSAARAGEWGRAGSQLHFVFGHAWTGVWAAAGRLEHPGDAVTLGAALPNVRIDVVDERGERCAVGVPGSIFVQGPGFARTASGDRGRWRSDGRLELLGRTDDCVLLDRQVVDPEFTDRLLRSHPEVVDVATLVTDGESSRPGLYSYVVPASSMLESAALRRHVASSLPIRLQPHSIVLTDAIARDPQGRPEITALPAAAASIGRTTAPRANPATPTERQLAAIWQALLGLDAVAASDNFFDLGGHSLLAMQAIEAMERETGKRINPRAYLFDSLAQIAGAYESTPAAPPAAQPKSGIFRRLFGRGRT